jgi:hypothetical protein
MDGTFYEKYRRERFFHSQTFSSLELWLYKKSKVVKVSRHTDIENKFGI